MARKNNLCTSHAVRMIWNDLCGHPKKMKDLFEAFEAEMSHATVSKFVTAQVACGNAEKGEGRQGRVTIKTAFEDAFACARALSCSGITCMHDNKRFPAACENRQIKSVEVKEAEVKIKRPSFDQTINRTKSTIKQSVTMLEEDKESFKAKIEALNAKKETLKAEIAAIDESIASVELLIKKLEDTIDVFKLASE